MHDAARFSLRLKGVFCQQPGVGYVCQKPAAGKAAATWLDSFGDRWSVGTGGGAPPG